jgi:catalase
MTEEQARNCSFDPFDLTKVFSQNEYPLHKVGKLTLNENPTDYFSQIEQAAFNPAHMPPGIEASPDKILQVCVYSAIPITVN